MQPTAPDPALLRFQERWRQAFRGLLPQPGWHLLAAVSGGCDSVLLGWLLQDEARRAGADLTIGHIHHGLRPEADEEEAWVRALAAAWQVPVRVARVAPAEEAQRRGWSIEQAARELRLAALVRLADEAQCDGIALGHHMDDQAETLLLRILRGTGPRGLGAMASRAALPRATGTTGRARTLYRPLLAFRRAELRDAARRAELRWMEDASNRDCQLLRNRVRHELIPHLVEAYNPRLVESLAALARSQRRESAPVAAAAHALRRRAGRTPHIDPEELIDPPAATGEPIELSLRRLAGEPEAVLSRLCWLVYQELAGHAAVLGHRHIGELLALIQADSGRGPVEVHLPNAVRARRVRDRVRFERHDPRPDPRPGARGRTRGGRQESA